MKTVITQVEFGLRPSFGYHLAGEERGNKSSITDGTLMKLNMHNNTVVIYIKKFQEISFIGYLVMAEDGKNH